MIASYPIANFPSANEFIQRWNQTLDRLDYRGRRQVLWRRIRPPLPRFLYKYRRLDQPHSSEKLRETLVESVLQLRPPAGFNDPFDTSARFVVEGTVEQRRARFKEIVRTRTPRVSWKEQERTIRRLMSATAKELSEVCQASLAGLRNSTGVYCFAGTPRSTLMWSHYAQDHTGICLQFERVHDHHVLLHALPVVYDDSYPIVNWIVGMHRAIGTMLFAKDPAWKYEQESRIVLPDQAGRYLRLRPAALRGIILGCRSDSAVVATVDDLLAQRAARGHPPIHVYKATQHPNRFRLVIRERAAL
jgi:hypothetical protein